MTKIKYNQFQSHYNITNGNSVLVDFLRNEIKVMSDRIEFEYEYDLEYTKLATKLDNILAKKTNDVLYITFITSLNCNMHCVYCYEKNVGAFNKNLQLELDLDAIISFVKEEYILKSYRKINVTILGGEPLLEKNINKIDKFIAGINKISINTHFSIVTNGINVKKYINQIVKWKINDIQVTLDGTELIHNSRRYSIDNNINSFISIVEGLDTLCDNNITAYLRTNVDKNNIDDICNLGKFIIKKQWLKKGIKPYLYPVTTSGCTNYTTNDSEIVVLKNVLKELGKCSEVKNVFGLDFHGIEYISNILNGIQPRIKTRFCGVSQGQYVLTPEGDILNCWWGLEEKIFKVGRIQEKSYSIDYTKINKFYERNILNIPQCINCKFKYLCGGGCTYREFFNKGSVDSGQCYPYDALIKEYLNYAIS